MVISEQNVLEALRGVKDPSVDRDIVSAKFVKDVKIDAGRVSFTVEQAFHGASSRQQVGEAAGAAVKKIAGVSAVEVTMTAKVRPAVISDLSKQPVAGVKNTIAVGAGKGGVGKTTVSVNLAIALSQAGARVAMIDGDVYGPNVPMMLGISTELGTDGQRIVPAVQYGIQLISMAFLTKDDTPVIWRGPMLHGVIQQFFREAAWDDVDYLIVDLPPGTGDVALSLSQTIPVAGAVLVTTPQAVSVADTKRAVRMYEKLNVTPLGLVENMSHFVCPPKATFSARAGARPSQGRCTCRSSAGSRSTSPFVSAATPACQLWWASRSRRPRRHSARLRNSSRRRSPCCPSRRVRKRSR